jgi:hypothetical protein
MNDKNLRDKLERQFGAIPRSSKSTASTNDQKNKPPRHYYELAAALNGSIVTNYCGAFCVVEEVYRADYFHGQFLLEDFVTQTRIPHSAFQIDGTTDTSALENMLFLDTETTGLGGAGTVPFLIGCGYVRGNNFVVRQYFIPDYTEESSMLEAFLAEFESEPTIVTYNGAAFDLPIIRDRFIINRVAREIPAGHHLDLLPPTRRLFRRRLSDCTLQNIEREIFGLERHEDIPGYLIPSAYFDWLSDQTVGLIGDILEHNRLDIVSMLYLVVHLARVYESDGATLDEVDDLHSLSKVFGRRREYARTEQLYDRIDQLSESTPAADLRLFHAANFKRSAQIDKAVPLWQQLSRLKSREGFYANVELAVYYEHKQKDIERALKHARKAFQYRELTPAQLRAAKKRLDRLKRKAPDKPRN